MKKRSILALVLLASSSLGAQQAPASAPAAPPKPVSYAEANFRQYTSIREEVTKLVEKMPAENFSFQPTPDIKTFAANVAHIAASNIGQCGFMLDGRKMAPEVQALEKTATTKPELVKALADGYALCDQYFAQSKTNESLTSKRYNSVMMENGVRTPVSIEHGALVTSLLSHNNEMYGYMSVYLRLKGIVPPTSEKK
jgi:hypothetical protein